MAGRGRWLKAAASVIILLASYSPAPALAGDDGHCVMGSTGSSTTWYFAEGCTRYGFNTFLCLGNPQDEMVEARVTYYLGDGVVREQGYSLSPLSRLTVPLHGAEGSLGYSDDIRGDVSMKVTAPLGIVAERPMYFNYPGSTISGGHDVMGATCLARDFFFAEGCTGYGFDEWVCVLNPQDVPAGLAFRFQTQEAGEKVVSGCTVPAHSRATFKVNDLLGPDQQASLALESDQLVLAERAMYFDYQGRGAHGWKGGHCVMGAAAQSTESYFAEGTTRDNFEEWLTLQNSGSSSITITAEYQFGPGQGTVQTRDYAVGASRRLTLYVPDEVGAGKDVSVRLTSSFPFLAERPVYFEYTGWESDWTGGHCVTGAAAPALEWQFAEGYTGPGFHTWLCLQNPTGKPATVEVDYLTREQGALPARQVTIPPASRQTLRVNDDAGAGLQLSILLKVTAGEGIVAERPMYFHYQPNDVISLTAVGDVNLDSHALRANGYGYAWESVGEAMRSTDLTFANLECTISYGGAPVPGKEFHFCGSPEGLPSLRDSGGVNVVSQANNHARDYGGEAMLDCLAYLQAEGIPWCGAGADYVGAHSPALLTVQGSRVAFLAYDDIGWPGWPAGAGYPGVANAKDTAGIVRDITAAREIADLVVVSFHWGTERDYVPDATQRSYAHLAVNSGADLVLGHHPHVIQGFEIYQGKLIAYSLGNFVFEPGDRQCDYTILTQVTFDAGGFREATIYPAHIENGRPVIMNGTAADGWLLRVAGMCADEGTSMSVAGGVGHIP